MAKDVFELQSEQAIIGLEDVNQGRGTWRARFFVQFPSVRAICLLLQPSELIALMIPLAYHLQNSDTQWWLRSSGYLRIDTLDMWPVGGIRFLKYGRLLRPWVMEMGISQNEMSSGFVSLTERDLETFRKIIQQRVIKLGMVAESDGIANSCPVAPARVRFPKPLGL